jgi:ElaB/YqjD/DUF883 family membrane-anchored ribosome-binding protein
MAAENEAQTRTPDEVQDEIGQTRAELDDTLSEIGRRLSPEELKERTVTYLKESAARAGDVARQNPGTVALAGCAVIGAFVLRNQRRMRAREEQAEQIRMLWERVTAVLADGVGNARPALHMSEVVSKVADVANRARHNLSEAVGEVAARAEDALRKESIADLAQPARRLIASLEESSREHALLSLAIAAGAGAMLSSLFRR